MARLNDEMVLISGGASGLGLAIVQRFIEEGASVGVLDKSADALESLRQQYGDQIVTVEGDVRSYASNEKAVAKCVSHFGKLDCVIGNAGIWDYNISLVDLEPDLLQQSFDELFQVNVLGYLNLAKAALRHLVHSKGSIIYTLSNAAFHPAGGGAIYTATKHSVVGLVKQLAYELAPHVRVNGVAPGIIPTRLKGPDSLGMAQAEFPVEMFSRMAPEVLPVGLMPSCEDYTGAFVFFASRRDNVPATGTVLNHDGGFNAAGLTQPRAGDDLQKN